MIHLINGQKLKETSGITHGHNLELLLFMEEDVELMEEILLDARVTMKIHLLLELVAQQALDVEDILEVNLPWIIMQMDFLTMHQAQLGDVEKLNLFIGQLVLDIEEDMLTDFVRFLLVESLK